MGNQIHETRENQERKFKHSSQTSAKISQAHIQSTLKTKRVSQV